MTRNQHSSSLPECTLPHSRGTPLNPVSLLGVSDLSRFPAESWSRRFGRKSTLFGKKAVKKAGSLPEELTARRLVRILGLKDPPWAPNIILYTRQIVGQWRKTPGSSSNVRVHLPLLIEPSEVCDKLHISTTALRRWEMKSAIPFVALGKVRRYLPKAVEEAMR